MNDARLRVVRVQTYEVRARVAILAVEYTWKRTHFGSPRFQDFERYCGKPSLQEIVMTNIVIPHGPSVLLPLAKKLRVTEDSEALVA